MMRVSANGSTPQLIAKPAQGEVVFGPQVLSGGSDVIFTLRTSADAGREGQVVAHLAPK